MTVYRCFVEKKPAYAVEAGAVFNDLTIALRNDHVKSVRVLNRYDLENILEEDYKAARYTILSEPQVDHLYEETMPEPAADEYVLAVEYLPGQFDQRADSCSQCIQLATCRERPEVRSARIYFIKGELTDADRKRIEETLINPVEARKAKLSKPETIRQSYPHPELPVVVEGFRDLDEAGLESFLREYGLAMDLADIKFLQKYFIEEEQRDPRITEIKVVDTYWSDHCRHTTFGTIIDNVDIEPAYAAEVYDEYLDLRKQVLKKDRPVTLMDLATIGVKALKQSGKLNDLDESEEINACSVKIKADIDGKEEDWLLMFKNETHNHPTEIEPFGGAATCLGGAIRDPLSGRSYVYQAMRITGAGDPLTPVDETLAGKLPQRKLVTTAAAGYSSYGNQIGLATGEVHELYHPGYVAKHMEVGAVIAAAPAENVIRERPEPGDVVILLGGRTGRDGIGGATGSSKAHSVESLETCGAEVQKGNAPEERKLQRLFRNPEATRLIRRCNDFGAGGVSVAIGELADGLMIDLNKVPRKYEGLDGTELAISESQERMAVVVRNTDAARFQELADAENLESTIVAEVQAEPRMVMTLEGTEIVNLSRAFLNSNGAEKHTSVKVKAPGPRKQELPATVREGFLKTAGDLNIASQKGLSERFDSTIGSGTVLMPFGGKTQMTPAQAMAAKLPVLDGNTDTVSLMTWGFDPYESEYSPFHGAQTAVITSAAKIVCAGGDLKRTWLSFQEYFGRMTSDPARWGLPFSALLGALKAQLELSLGAIGGKDSMSGSFENIDVPPTLISFAVSVTDTKHVVSDEWKGAGHYLYMLKPCYDENGLVDWESLRQVFGRVSAYIKEGRVCSAYTLERGGLAEGLLKCSLGNRIGFTGTLGMEQLFTKCAGAIVLETAEKLDEELLGMTTDEFVFRINDETIPVDELQKVYEDKLQSVYPYLNKTDKQIEAITWTERSNAHASYTVERPHVLIPVFPGTNCEYDTAKAFEAAGAEAEIFVIRNLTPKAIEDSVTGFAEAIRRSHIIAIPGGFSGGDEPDGSGKFITAFFRNPEVSEALADLLDNREGLMCGICNGFQALVKLGLVPYGRIIDIDEHCPTLTYNKIGRHQSMLVRTRIASVKSPWLRYAEAGDIQTVAISNGEGRFVAEEHVLKQLIENGQVTTQYVDLEGNPTSDIRFSPNDSVMAIEGITSPDGRIFGKMGHSERSADGLYQNIPDLKLQEMIFKGAVDYFR